MFTPLPYMYNCFQFKSLMDCLDRLSQRRAKPSSVDTTSCSRILRIQDQYHKTGTSLTQTVFCFPPEFNFLHLLRYNYNESSRKRTALHTTALTKPCLNSHTNSVITSFERQKNLGPPRLRVERIYPWLIINCNTRAH